MRLLSLSAIAMLAIACTSFNANAQCGDTCNQCGSTPIMDEFCAVYHANVNWPAQYIPPARRSVLSAYDSMINNGWRRQNLLGTYHFDPGTNELTDAGRLKVNWILSQTPPHRRSIFVQRGARESQTATRVASVHSWASNMSPAIGTVDVNDTHIVAEGRSAGAVDNIFVGFRANQRPPVLPVSSGGTQANSTAQ
ncbi:MAG: hypothetical protein GXP26_09295 [Planctomycetes bacterium]|nr:hypothetical protein [Planctomycetota bacterium]